MPAKHYQKIQGWFDFDNIYEARVKAANDGDIFVEVGVWKGAQLTKQLSKTPCVEGHNWGWDQRGVWVSRGCRAEFVVW